MVNSIKDYLLLVKTKLYRSNIVERKIKLYYSKNNSYNDIYKCTIGNVTKEILFLSASNWHGCDVDILNNNILMFENRKIDYKVSPYVIWKRKYIFGQRLVNLPALYFIEAHNPNQLFVGTCDYFQRITLSDKMEMETLKYCYMNPRTTKLRSMILNDFNHAIKRNIYPTSIGCDVALVIKYDEKQYLAVQKRSHKTSSYGGQIAVVPSFGFSPITEKNEGTSFTSAGVKNNIFLYNIVKEYCEEIFNNNELESCPDGHSDPFWFYDAVPEAKELLDALENKSAYCKYLGFGFDLIKGISNTAVLLYIEDEKLSKKIFHESVSNWEYRDSTSNSGFFFVEINSSRLGDYLYDNLYQCETAFTISLALKEMSKINGNYSSQ